MATYRVFEISAQVASAYPLDESDLLQKPMRFIRFTHLSRSPTAILSSVARRSHFQRHTQKRPGHLWQVIDARTLNSHPTPPQSFFSALCSRISIGALFAGSGSLSSIFLTISVTPNRSSILSRLRPLVSGMKNHTKMPMIQPKVPNRKNMPCCGLLVRHKCV